MVVLRETNHFKGAPFMDNLWKDHRLNPSPGCFSPLKVNQHLAWYTGCFMFFSKQMFLSQMSCQARRNSPRQWKIEHQRDLLFLAHLEGGTACIVGNDNIGAFVFHNFRQGFPQWLRFINATKLLPMVSGFLNLRFANTGRYHFQTIRTWLLVDYWQ